VLSDKSFFKAVYELKLGYTVRELVFGILWMLGSGFCFVVVIGLVRYLDGSLPASEASFIRFAIGLVFFLPYFVSFGKKRRYPTSLFKSNNFFRYIFRALCHSLGIICWFFAMAKLPVAEVTAIGYLTPVFVTIGAVLVFKEKISYGRICAIFFAFCGVLIILRPGFQEFSIARGVQLCATIFFAGSYLLAKDLTRTETPTAIVAMMTLYVTIALLPVAVIFWIEPSMKQMMVLVLVAFFATAAHFSMTKALALAPAIIVQPVTFLQLIWATLLGTLVFEEIIDFYVLLGGFVIIGSITLISYYEISIKQTVRPPH
jgi:drug/metabolite transporter (DMT)-like permease